MARQADTDHLKGTVLWEAAIQRVTGVSYLTPFVVESDPLVLLDTGLSPSLGHQGC
jgi:hypothetical protein